MTQTSPTRVRGRVPRYHRSRSSSRGRSRQRRVGAAAMGCLAGALALGVSACGGDGGGGGGVPQGGAKKLTIYSSMPLQGASSPQTKAIVNGMKLALEQAGSKAGEHTIKFVSLDNSTAQAGTWTPEATWRTRSRPRRTTRRRSTSASSTAAPRRSDPLLNEGGVPQISPANTAVGLTAEEPGANAGEPDKFYPTGTRTYTRIVARDSIKGPVMVDVMKEDGCTKVSADQRQGGLRRRAGDGDRGRGEQVRAQDHRQRGDRQAGAELPLAGPERRGGGRRLLRLLGHHGQQRGPALQGLRGGASDAKLYGPTASARAGSSIPARAASRPTSRRASSARPRRCRRPSSRRRASGSSRTTGEVRREVSRSVLDLRL